jgi:integrase
VKPETRRPKSLTARFVETVAPPASGRQEYKDAALPGFRFRVYASGRRTFSHLYRDPAGVQKRATWDFPAHSLAEARDAAREVVRAVAKGERPVTRRQVAKEAALLPGDVNGLADTYVDQYLKKYVRRWKAAQGEIDNHLRPYLGPLPLAEVSRAHVRQMLAKIAWKAPVAANRALQRCRALFRWAVENDLAPTDPTAGIKKPTKERPVDRTLSDDELVAVWRATDSLAYPAQQFARLVILTGQRRDDVRLMHWNEIDLQRGDWTIPARRYKADRAHLIPLTAAMKAMLEEMPLKTNGGFVLSVDGGKSPYANVQKPKAAIDDASAVTGWTWHDCRRTLRTGLSRLRIRPDIAERVIGHAVGGRLGQVYDTHEFRAERLAALEAWGAHVMSCVEGSADPDNVVSIVGARQVS